MNLSIQLFTNKHLLGLPFAAGTKTLNAAEIQFSNKKVQNVLLPSTKRNIAAVKKRIEEENKVTYAVIEHQLQIKSSAIKKIIHNKF